MNSYTGPKVRDLRKKEQFILDDVYLNGYAKIFGPIGTAVYLSLCRRADKIQSCFPSEKTIAKDHGITDRTVRKYIKLLRMAHLIRIGKSRSKNGKWLHNTYYLLDKSGWRMPEEIVSYISQGKIITMPEEDNGITKGTKIPPKDAHQKETHKKDYSIIFQKMRQELISKKVFPPNIRTQAQEIASKEDRMSR